MNIYSFSRYLQKWKSWFRLSLKLIHWVCLSNNPPSHCISLNSFSQTLLLIISFPSYILYNLHILIHPLVCQHILFLIHLTYFYWPSPGFPDHLLLLLPPPWVPRSLSFTECPPLILDSSITHFYRGPLKGFPDHLLLLIPPWAPPRWHLDCAVQGMLRQLSSFLLPQRQICCWTQVSDWLPLTEVLGSLTYTCRGTAIEESIPIEQAVNRKKNKWIYGKEGNNSYFRRCVCI